MLQMKDIDWQDAFKMVGLLKVIVFVFLYEAFSLVNFKTSNY
jgi:hypothetical protein